LGEQPPALGEAFYWLGFYYESANVRNYSMAERCWQAASRAGMGGFADKARLQLARYQVEVAGKADEALATLAQVAEASLDDPEKRLRKLVTGDALLLQGKAAEARNSYRAAGTLVNPRDRDQESRGRVRLESAKDYIRRGEYELAEDALRQIEWETPLARLSVEAGLTRIKLSLARKEHPRALNRCLQFLEVTIVDTDHADLLYQLAQIYLALGREEPAQSALNRLLKEHPYSEAAALAKDKWGGRVPKPASKPGAKPPR
jgi:tetratricopeptide (TPR) repeat protein